ncbi:MAG: hypothetical protein Q9177_006987, partial [Variospora cf. flavescens]
MDNSEQGSPGPTPRQTEAQQRSEPEPSTRIDSTNDISTSSKMPGTLNLDDHEDYLSSSSGEISESASHDSMDTMRPEAEQGLTADHPTLTTYFEGEIIGPKYTFQTRHPSWGATDKTDMQHWARFPAWRPLAKQAKKPDFHYKNFAQRENIFM